MKTWKWYAEQLKKNPPYRLSLYGDYKWIKSEKKRKKQIKEDKKRLRRARKFEREWGLLLKIAGT